MALPLIGVTLSGLVGYFFLKWKKKLVLPSTTALTQKSARAGTAPRQRLPASMATINAPRFDMILSPLRVIGCYVHYARTGCLVKRFLLISGYSLPLEPRELDSPPFTCQIEHLRSRREADRAPRRSDAAATEGLGRSRRRTLFARPGRRSVARKRASRAHGRRARPAQRSRPSSPAPAPTTVPGRPPRQRREPEPFSLDRGDGAAST